ncbi:GGDEF domain-containing protein [Candidatus Xianfuyuplasma coldseepsis]|uniref:GGDEF domain-containing protein n=1 Tax=Candidatus Xianfuyuplasma coldseepsis TaxID=2782163 RepID=A0A7L7KR60_9MOLU|nr:GGDEF domain-containing protein [Xianfuyuplasma coldseepsis]QMS85311.1 GGDEF domain-containing protein [Xianfuyuplasma coldseepsis]
MKFKYFNKALKTIEQEFQLDGIKDVVLHREDKCICYSVIDELDDLVLHLIVGSFTLFGYQEQESLRLSQLLADMDLDNMFAKVRGRQEYYDGIASNLLDVSTPSNITFPIKNNNERIWLRLMTDQIDVQQKLIALHFTIVTPFITIEEDVFYKTHHDSLTGLFNKYTFDYHYGERYRNEQFHVMFLDLDDFKIINDQLGHREGDRFLQQFAAILQLHEDDHSRFYRLGGDEFVGLLFDSEETIRRMAEDILKQTQALSQEFENIHTTVSIGVIQATVREDVARKADRLMYQAKHNGKNQYLYKMEE